jgi:hypothetical protein
MTIEAWIRPVPPFGVNPTIVSHNFVESFWFGLEVASADQAKLRFYRSGGLGASSIGLVEMNRWSHVAAAYDGVNVRFYVNGDNAGTVPLTHAGAGVDAPLYIGGQAGGCCGSPSGLSFNGFINEVRVWAVARSGTEVRDNRFVQLRGVANLAAVFDTGGAHEDIAEAVGVPGAGASERVEGIIPHDMLVPRAVFPGNLVIDGNVDLFDEYLGAEQLVIRYRPGSNAVVGQAVAHLVHTDTDLYVGVCPISSTVGGWDPDDSWIGLLLDPDYSRHALAQSTDYQLQSFLGAIPPELLVGNGAGAYSPPGVPPPPDDWAVARMEIGEFGEQCMEFRVSSNLIGTFTAADTDGLAMAHFWLSGIGQDHLGPGSAVWNAPATWARVQYDEAGPVLPRARIFGSIPEGRCNGGDRDANTCRNEGECPAGDCVLEGRTVWLMSSLRDAPLYTTTTTASGTFSFSSGSIFTPGVPVPEGVDLTVQADGCAGCLYPDAIVDEAAMASTGIRPLAVHGLSVTFPSVCDACPALCGSSGSCTYPGVIFAVRQPPGPLVVDSIEPDKLRAPIVLRDTPRKTIAGSRLRIRGENLHEFIDVYLDGFCVEFPAYCERVPMVIVDRGRDAMGDWVDVELQEEPPPSVFGDWGVTLHDRWTWGRTPTGIRGWLRAGTVEENTDIPYPDLWGFEFENDPDNSNWPNFTAVYGNNAYFCVGLPLPGGGCGGCRAPRPSYLALFAVFKIVIDGIDGSCVGMAATSQLFWHRDLHAEDFQAGAHFPSGLNGRADSDGTLRPPKPDRYDFNLCSAWDPVNLWAHIRTNHGIQLSEEFMEAVVDDMRGGGFSIDGNPLGRLAELEKSPLDHVVSMVPRVGKGHAVTPYGTQDAGRLCNGGCNDLMPCTSDADCPNCDDMCAFSCVDDCPDEVVGACSGGSCIGGCNKDGECTSDTDCPDCDDSCPLSCVNKCPEILEGTCREFSRISVYDNNFPENENRVIWINRTDNQYRAPRASGEWRGTGIYTIPVDIWRHGRHGPGLGFLLDFVLLLTFGGADAHYTTDAGGEWGWREDGTFVDALPGAVSSPPLEGTPLSPTRDIPLLLPAVDPPPHVQINARGGDFVFHTAQGGTTVQILGFNAADGHTAHVDLTRDGNRFSAFRYEPDQRGIKVVPKIGMVLGDGQELMLHWLGMDVPAGAGVRFFSDPGAFGGGIDNDTGVPLRFHLMIEHVDGPAERQGRGLFGPFEVPAGARHKVAIADWPDGNSLRSELDRDRDGVPESTAFRAARPCGGLDDAPPIDANRNGAPDTCETGGDFDGDFAVDHTDWRRLVDCLTGPGVLTAKEMCVPADLDFDGDVDLKDASLMGLAFAPAPQQGHGCCAPGSAGCIEAAVEACVCAVDPYCCDVQWDQTCVLNVDRLACGACAPEHDCCHTGGLECIDQAVAACVCAQDPYCCTAEWDATCVQEVDTLGCGFCTGLPDCCATGADCANPEIRECICAVDSFCCAVEWDGRCVAMIDLAACGTCADHDCCITGGPGCDDPVVEECVCTVDPHCCTDGWDRLCVQELTNEECGTCGSHLCCEVGDAGCEDPEVQACVCAEDPFCCTEEWDPQCVDNVGRLACGSCTNDSCGNAELLSLPGFAVGNVTDAMPSDAPACDDVPVTTPGRWYRLVGTGTAVTATTCSDFTEFDTRISVFSGPCDDLQCAVANDDDCDFGGHSTVRWCSEPDVEYRVFMHGSDVAGGFHLSAFADGAACGRTDVFQHTADQQNVTDNWTTFSRPSTDGLPDSILFITQNFNPGGLGGTYNPHPVGVWYDGAMWSIFNEDLAAMPIGATFNVAVAPPSDTVFVHLATENNTSGNSTVISHPDSDDDPNAMLLVTQDWNPGGVGGTYNPSPIGVWYDGSQWNVFNQDLSALPVGAAFSVSVLSPSETAFVHVANPNNTLGHYTLINSPAANGMPGAVILVTQNWNPGGQGNIYNDAPVGVRYDLQTSQWAIFNENLANLPDGAAFNVTILPESDE